MSSETYTPDKLIAAGFPIVADEGILITGQNLTRGALLAKIAASGKLTQAIVALGVRTYAENAATAGIFSITALVAGTAQNAYTLEITDTVSAGAETVTWGATSLVIECEATVSTVSQVLVAAGGTFGLANKWADLSGIAAAAVAAIGSTAMSALTNYVAGVAGSVGGIETPYGILAQDTDASGGDKSDTPIYLTGAFNEGQIGLGGSDTVADVKDLCRNKSIYLKTREVS